MVGITLEAAALKLSLTRRAMITLVATIGIGLTTLAVAPAASAAPVRVRTGWIYISAPTWLGNCEGGDAGHLIYMTAVVGDTWHGGDAGNDLLYVKVKLNENQQVSYSGFCSRARIPEPGVSVTIRPTRNNQTFFLGPEGVRHKN